MKIEKKRKSLIKYLKLEWILPKRVYKLQTDNEYGFVPRSFCVVFPVPLPSTSCFDPAPMAIGKMIHGLHDVW